MKIVHLSDLHLQTDQDFDVLSLVKRAVTPLEPTIIIISGDLVNHPNKKLLLKVKEKLEELKSEGKAEDIVVVPGNHDCKYFGMFGFGNHRKIFDEVFEGWSGAKLYEGKGRAVAIFRVDSNHTKSKISFARGRVGIKETDRFIQEVVRLQKEHGDAYRDSYKILVLHHHPLPIAQADNDNPIDQDAFLGLEDAGSFLRTMIYHKIDLVLHGHKHYPFFAKLRMSTNLHEISILAAGSACKAEPHGNTFNEIKLEDATVEHVEWARDRNGPFSIKSSMALFDYESVRSHAYERYLQDQSVWYKDDKAHHKFRIDQDGDCNVDIEHCIRRHGNGTSSSKTIPVAMRSFHATYRAYKIKAKSENISIVWREIDSENGKLEGQIEFSTPLQYHTSSVRFTEKFKIFNAFALNVEQRERICGAKSPEFVVATPRAPTETLVIEIGFPMPLERSDVHSLVHASTNDWTNPNYREQQYCERFLQLSHDGKTATLTVTHPLKDHRYGISWELPEKNQETALSPKIEGQAKELRRQLLSLPTVNDHTNQLFDTLKVISDTIEETYPRAGNEVYKIGLMVYDDKPEVRGLRFVAGRLPDAYWKMHLTEGQGLAGRAHKNCQPLLYVKNRTRENLNYSAKQPSGEADPALMLCVPLRYPLDTVDAHEVIGVVAFWTTYEGSSLIDLYDDASGLKVSEITRTFETELLANKIIPNLLPHNV